jgi:hypothetical protein
VAINIPIISEFDSKGLQSAQNAFNNFRTKVNEADGAMGKMKAGFGAATDYMRANAGMLAATAGTALATFAVKAVKDFQDLALQVDKFSNVTRVAAQESSRWIEVAGDLGIETTAVEGAINKMNRALSTSRDDFAELGIEIARTNDGTIDANETFIRTLDALGRMKDPAARAAAATKLLGKSWSEVSELVEMGAGSLREALASVGEAKLIDEAEIQKAKDFREAQDRLKDAFESVAIAIGTELVPMMTDLINSIAPLAEKAGWLSRAWKVGFGAMTGNVKMLQDGMTGGASNLDQSVNEVTMSFWEQQQQMYRLRYEALKLTDQFSALDEVLAELKGEVDERQAWRNLQDDIQRAGQLALEAFMERTPEALRASESALDSARLAAAEYILKLDDIPEEQKTQIIADLDDANLDEIEQTLDNLARDRRVTITARVRAPEVGSGGREQGAPPAGTVGNIVDTPFGRFRDLGGGAFEPVNLGSSTRSAQATNVTVNVAGSVTSERDLVESVRKGLVDAQRSGYNLVYSNT